MEKVGPWCGQPSDRGRLTEQNRSVQCAWRSGAAAGRRTCDQEVAGSIPGRALLRNDRGQVVHTHIL